MHHFHPIGMQYPCWVFGEWLEGFSMDVSPLFTSLHPLPPYVNNHYCGQHIVYRRYHCQIQQVSGSISRSDCVTNPVGNEAIRLLSFPNTWSDSYVSNVAKRQVWTFIPQPIWAFRISLSSLKRRGYQLISNESQTHLCRVWQLNTDIWAYVGQTSTIWSKLKWELKDGEHVL